MCDVAGEIRWREEASGGRAPRAGAGVPQIWAVDPLGAVSQLPGRPAGWGSTHQGGGEKMNSLVNTSCCKIYILSLANY